MKGESPSDQAHFLWWKKLWQLHIPTKVKTFLWRACHNASPVGERLVSKNVSILKRCGEEESVEHAFMVCDN